jgi:hypothetical protein
VDEVSADHWVECSSCEGTEGHETDDGNGWVPCSRCLGEGGDVHDGTVEDCDECKTT